MSRDSHPSTQLRADRTPRLQLVSWGRRQLKPLLTGTNQRHQAGISYHSESMREALIEGPIQPKRAPQETVSQAASAYRA